MFATNFESIEKERIHRLFEFIQNNQFSNFYSEKYVQMLEKNWDEYPVFSTLPFLTKNDILETPVSKRTFVDENSIRAYTVSSGTSKNPIPSIVPHTVRNYKELSVHGYDTIKKEGRINLLLLLNGVNSSIPSFLDTSENEKISIIIGNVSNLKMTATLAKEVAIDAIVTTPSILYAFSKELKNISYDMNKIVWISLGSEYCTQVMYDVFRSKFPKTDFNFRYGNAEFHGKIGIRCEYLNKNCSPGIFHINPYAIVEIVDEKGSPVQFGELGEVIVTDTLLKAFPLIRYRIGDYATLYKRECECGNQYQLEFAGRANHDFLKFHGVTLRTEMIYESLRDYLNIFENRFEMHVYENLENDEVKPYLILRTSLQNSHKNLEKDTHMLDLIIKDISKKLFLSPQKTYADIVTLGNFLPMKIELIEKWENESKNIGIVSHL